MYNPYKAAGDILSETPESDNDFIVENITEHYTIEELSERFGISPTAMKRCFKGMYGAPVYAYVRTYRLQVAVTKTITKNDVRAVLIIVPPIELQNEFELFIEQVNKSKFIGG